MSTVSELKNFPTPGSPDDPFRYGWRYVKHRRDDGTQEIEQVPLTLEDVLHPEEGDFHLLTAAHSRIMVYLFLVLKLFLSRRRSDTLVLMDHRVAWDVPGLRAHGPDVAVFLKYFDIWNERTGTFDVGKQGIRPSVLIEVVSESTRENDVVAKMEHYHWAGVPFYVVIDLNGTAEEPTWSLHGYRNTPDGYVELPFDPDGRLYLEVIDVRLGVNGPDVICYDGANDQMMHSYEEVENLRLEEMVARAQAEQRVDIERMVAQQERVRADEEKQRAEVERIRAEQQQMRAEQEHTRAEQEHARAEQERARADKAERALAESGHRRNAEFEARVQALELELRRLRGDN